MQKIRLRAESDKYLQIMDSQWEYLQNNFGSLLIGMASNAVKSKMPVAMQRLLPAFEINDEQNKNKDSNVPVIMSFAEAIADQALEAIPFFFKGIKPAVIAYVLRKIKELIFKK